LAPGYLLTGQPPTNTPGGALAHHEIKNLPIFRFDAQSPMDGSELTAMIVTLYRDLIGYG
jgi:hypothetical protein